MKPRLNKTMKQSWIVMLSLAMATLFGVPQVFAASGDTAAGTPISNQATINYTVGGTLQSPVDSDNDGNAANGLDPTEFLVDHKVRVLVSQVNDATVVPAGTNDYLEFDVTNDGNTAPAPATTLDIQLTYESVGTDDFDMVADTFRIYLETNAVPDGFQAATDTLISDYTPPGAGSDVIGWISLPRDTTARIYLVANTPSGASAPVDNDEAHYWLVGTAWDGSGGAPGVVLDEDTDGDSAGTSEVVWADDQSALPSGDTGINGAPVTAPDGKHAAMAIFEVVTATMDVQKRSSVIADPFGSTYRVPGAYVQYDITITNNGTASATLTTLTDPVPTNTTFDPDLATDSSGSPENVAGDSFRVVVTNSTRAEDGNNQYFTGAVADADGMEQNAGNITAVMATVLPAEPGPGYTAGELKAGEIVTITFNVIID